MPCLRACTGLCDQVLRACSRQRAADSIDVGLVYAIDRVRVCGLVIGKYWLKAPFVAAWEKHSTNKR